MIVKTNNTKMILDLKKRLKTDKKVEKQKTIARNTVEAIIMLK